MSAPMQDTENEAVGREVNGDPMEETTPAPEDPTGNMDDGETAKEEAGDEGPAPPVHAVPEKEPVDPEAAKAAGNKFYKAGQYDKAIEEYSNGVCRAFRHYIRQLRTDLISCSDRG